jgi:hypothetical protein
MPTASEQSPFAFLPGSEVEEAHGSPAESEILHGNQKWHSKMDDVIVHPIKNKTHLHTDKNSDLRWSKKKSVL